MGEYANDQIRADIKRMTGIDPGSIEDDEPRKRFVKPLYSKEQCKVCGKRVKFNGLKNHMRDVHESKKP